MAAYPVLFVSHGGGPSFFLPDNVFPGMGRGSKADLFLRRMAETCLPHPPKAIVVISAHWDEPGKVQVTSAAQPHLLFDYYGFPKETYELKYGCPGEPQLAARIVSLLESAEIPAKLNGERGLDHGVFVPLLLIYPEAKIPVVQFSLNSNFDPDLHIRIGKALAPLCSEDILFLGSGFTTHNLSFPIDATTSNAFADWVNHAVKEMDLDALAHWAERAPFARAAHPHEDHFMPLLVTAGIASAAKASHAEVIFDDRIDGPRGAMAFGCYKFS